MQIYIDKKHIKKNPEKTIKHLLKINTFPETYNDILLDDVQCKKGKKRSIGEFYYIIKTIYPYISQKEVFKRIYATLIVDTSRQLICCPDVNKIVLHTSSPYWKFNTLGVIYDYNSYIADKRELEDKFTIDYFLKKVGFSQKEINVIFYNK